VRPEGRSDHELCLPVGKLVRRNHEVIEHTVEIVRFTGSGVSIIGCTDSGPIPLHVIDVAAGQEEVPELVIGNGRKVLSARCLLLIVGRVLPQVVLTIILI